VAEHKESAEYADLAQKAATDAIAEWTTHQKQQPRLFGDEGRAADVWRNAQSASGFCEVSRLFFANFTERYLNSSWNAKRLRDFRLFRTVIALLQRFARMLRPSPTMRLKHQKSLNLLLRVGTTITLRTKRPRTVKFSVSLATAFGKIREELQRERS
jgi:hypothetical protein